MKKIFVVGSIAVSLVAFGLAWRDARAARTAGADLHELVRAESVANAELRTSEARLAVVEAKATELRSAATSSQNARVAPTASSSDRALPTASPAPQVRKTAAEIAREDLAQSRSPNAQLRAMADHRLWMANVYRPLFSSLSLSPAEIEKLLEIESKYFALGMDIHALTKDGAVPANDSAVEKLRRGATQELHAALRELLGEQKVQQLRDYARSANARASVQDFAGYAVMSGVPLTAAQLERLVTVVANGSSQYRNGGPMHSLDKVDWDLVDAQARPLMSEAQWEIFTKVAPNPGSGTDRAWVRTLAAVQRAVQGEAMSKATQSGKQPGS